MSNKPGLLIAVAVYASCTNSADEAFVDDGVTPEQLDRNLSDIAKARKDLHFAHLAVHLKTPDVLTAWPLQQYN